MGSSTLHDRQRHVTPVSKPSNPVRQIDKEAGFLEKIGSERQRPGEWQVQGGGQSASESFYSSQSLLRAADSYLSF